MSQSTLSKLKPLNAAQRTELHARQAAFHTQAEPPQQKSKISPKEPPSLWRLVTEPEMSNNILREIKEQIGPQYLISNFESFIPAVITQKEWEKSAVRLETYTGDIFDTLKDITDGKISLYELSSNPELQAKIRKEMMEVEPELIDLLLDYPLSGTSISPQDLHGTIYQKTEDIAGMPDRLELLTSVEKLVSYLAIQRSCHNFQRGRGARAGSGRGAWPR